MSYRRLTVSCVLRSGGDYQPKHIIRLKKQIERHLSEPYLFCCLTDVPHAPELLEANPLRLWSNWPGWWAKLEIFRLCGPALYFDLDTTITGDLSPLAAAAQEYEFVALRDVYRGRDNPDALQSSVMAWRGDVSGLFMAFGDAPEAHQSAYKSIGDQGFIGDHRPKGTVFWQDIMPGMFLSYKVHIRQGEPLGDARVLVFHGQPRPWDKTVEGVNDA